MKKGWKTAALLGLLIFLSGVGIGWSIKAGYERQRAVDTAADAERGNGTDIAAEVGADNGETGGADAGTGVSANGGAGDTAGSGVGGAGTNAGGTDSGNTGENPADGSGADAGTDAPSNGGAGDTAGSGAGEAGANAGGTDSGGAGGAGEAGTNAGSTDSGNTGENPADGSGAGEAGTNAGGTDASGNGGTGGKKPSVSKTLATPAKCGALQVIGTQLCDKKGKAVQLRGISTHGLAWFPEYVNNDLFRQFREEWNVNVMRLAMYTHEYGGYCSGGDKEELKKLVKNGVKYATDNDMYVIIDWHVLNDQNPNTYKEDAKAFFKEMAKTYADNDNVLYEICNEPNGGTSWSEIKSYAEEIIPIIREYDSDAVIIVGTPNWSQYVDQAADDPITGYDNIMYALHFYAATHKQWLRDTMTAAIDNGLPIFVTEYGICDASGSGSIDKTEAASWVSTMNKYGISYVAWNLSNKDETSSIIRSSCKKTSGLAESDLSDSGKWLYQMLTDGNGGMAASTDQSGKPGNGSGDTGQAQGADTAQNPSGGSDTSGGGATYLLENKDVEISMSINSQWESDGQTCYQYTMSLKNVSGKNAGNWKVKIKFNEDITLQSGWNGQMQTEGAVLVITAEDYNGALENGDSITDIGFIISGSSRLERIDE